MPLVSPADFHTIRKQRHDRAAELPDGYQAISAAGVCPADNKPLMIVGEDAVCLTCERVYFRVGGRPVFPSK